MWEQMKWKKRANEEGREQMQKKKKKWLLWSATGSKICCTPFKIAIIFLLVHNVNWFVLGSKRFIRYLWHLPLYQRIFSLHDGKWRVNNEIICTHYNNRTEFWHEEWHVLERMKCKVVKLDIHIFWFINCCCCRCCCCSRSLSAKFVHIKLKFLDCDAYKFIVKIIIIIKNVEVNWNNRKIHVETKIIWIHKFLKHFFFVGNSTNEFEIAYSNYAPSTCFIVNAYQISDFVVIFGIVHWNWIYSLTWTSYSTFLCSVVPLLCRSSHSSPFSSSFFSIIIFISFFIFHHAIKRFFDSMCMVLFYIKFRSSVFYMFFALAPSCLSRVYTIRLQEYCEWVRKKGLFVQ